MILKLEKDINDLNCALDPLKEAHSSLFDERFNIFDTSVEKIKK